MTRYTHCSCHDNNRRDPEPEGDGFNVFPIIVILAVLYVFTTNATKYDKVISEPIPPRVTAK